MNEIFVAGVKITTDDHRAIVSQLSKFLQSADCSQVSTVNPEMIVKAGRDSYFRGVLNASTYNIADGFGVAIATLGRTHRFAGVDAMMQIVSECAQKQIPIYLLGGLTDDVAQRAQSKLEEMYPGVSIVGARSGLAIEENHGQLIYDEARNDELLNDINNSGALVLFVAFGMGKQEKWIHENFSQLEKVRIAMGVGGSFDYLAGVVPRAPRYWRVVGMEWLYRLWVEPRRLFRIINAVIVFPFIFLISLFKPDHIL